MILTMIDRIFQDIQDGELEEEDQQSLLVNLGWSRGTTWNELLHSRRVLLISEAGTGKTFECGAKAKQLWDSGEPAFFVELASLGSRDLRSQMDDDEEFRFDSWLRSQSDVATFFLDSIDELKLSRESFRQALKQFKKEIGSERLGRVRVVITSRPTEFDRQLLYNILAIPPESGEETFVKIAMGEEPDRLGEIGKTALDWRTVALLPLSDEQISEFATEQGIEDSAALLSQLKNRNALKYARRPQDLIELCADWQDHGCIRTHLDQVRANVRIKLQPRTDRPEPAELSVDKAIDGASRLALAMMVTRLLTIRHSAASDELSDSVALDPARILSDWNPDERKALLERPLFGLCDLWPCTLPSSFHR